MEKYINADALQEKINNHIRDYYPESVQLELICDAIAEAPTADVRENMHGEWIRYGTVLDCSACHNKIPAPITKMYPFCPNCGADMRGDA